MNMMYVSGPNDSLTGGSLCSCSLSPLTYSSHAEMRHRNQEYSGHENQPHSWEIVLILYEFRSYVQAAHRPATAHALGN